MLAFPVRATIQRYPMTSMAVVAGGTAIIIGGVIWGKALYDGRVIKELNNDFLKAFDEKLAEYKKLDSEGVAVPTNNLMSFIRDMKKVNYEEGEGKLRSRINVTLHLIGVLHAHHAGLIALSDEQLAKVKADFDIAAAALKPVKAEEKK